MRWRYSTKDMRMRQILTYSVDSTVGVVGIIINTQFVRMVTMIKNENNGCTKI